MLRTMLSRTLLAFAFALALVPVRPVAADGLSPPAGPVILTVDGEIVHRLSGPVADRMVWQLRQLTVR